MDAIAHPFEPRGPAVPTPTLEDVERWRQSPGHRLRVHLGFASGVAIALLVSAWEFSIEGYRSFTHLTFYLFWLSGLGLLAGYRLRRPRHPGPLHRIWWPLPRFRMRTLMLLVAYMALLFGLDAATRKLGVTAERCYQQSIAADSLARPYRVMAGRSAIDAERARANLAGFREGKVPDGLRPGQREFLQGLEVDPKVTPAYREHRRGLIRDAEQEKATRCGRNAALLGVLADYYERLAAKYDQAGRHPWLPIEPDPPVPPMP